MGAVNWVAVLLAAAVAAGLAVPWYRGAGFVGAAASARLALWLVPAWLMGHNFARVGGATLSAKPWLYPMMSGGFGLAIALPVVALLYGRHGLAGKALAVDAAYAQVAFLLMGGVFWLAA